MAAGTGDVIETVGGVVSGGVRVTTTVAVPLFPAEPVAVTVIALAPLTSRILAMVHDVVPDAVPLPPRPLTQVTSDVPADAMPESVTVLDEVL